MSAIVIARTRKSCVVVRAAGAKDGLRGPADNRTVFQLRSKSLRQIPLHDVVVAYTSCRRFSGAERAACFIAHDVDGCMVDEYLPTVQRLEAAFAPPVNAGHWHLDRAREVLLQLLPQCDALTPTQDPDDVA
jgi:hypothetical protein